MSKSIDLAIDSIKSILQQEHEAGHVNSLAAVADSLSRRETIGHYWQSIQTELATIDQQIRKLPALPPEEQIAWAQAVLAMRDVAFLELDTTGLEATDEIIRFTLIDSSLNTIDDFLMKPIGSRLSEKASFVNGIKAEQVEQEGLHITEAWERIRAAFAGRYIVSYSQRWDLQQLKAAAERHTLEPVHKIIGDDLQQHTTLYYHKEYYLTLANICERIGHPLPEHPNQTSLDRAKGQVHIMTAMANAVTDIRSVKAAIHADIDFDTDGMVDLDTHPF